MPDTDAGHRTVPHTADNRIEAWGPSRERCVAEAVAAMVGSFADVSGARRTGTVAVDVEADTGADALVAVLDEVIYMLDTRGLVPLHTKAVADEGRLKVQFATTSIDEVSSAGPVPKAVTLHDLRWDRRPAGWFCAVTLDV